MKIALNPNEVVVKAGDSSFMDNGSTVKGKLILTNQRIYFKPALNGTAHDDMEINPAEIEDVMFFNEKFLFPTGLNIVTKNGIQNKFLVKKRNDWSEMIVKMF